MPHQCVKCSRIIPVATKELLDGCSSCGGRFFFYIREDQLEKIKEQPLDIPEEDKGQIEKDVREMVGAVDETSPVILDLESVRITGSGKFELDIVKLFDRKSPVVYKLEEGKYIIDLMSTLQKRTDDLKEIKTLDFETDESE